MDAPKCRLCGERHWGACGLSERSRGGVESGHAKTGNKPGSVPGEEVLVPLPALRGIKSDGAAIQPCDGVTPIPRELLNTVLSCPVCERRRVANRDKIRRYRANRKSKGGRNADER